MEAAMTGQQNKSLPAHTRGDWDFDSGFIVAPDPSGKHPDIYIAELTTEDDEGRVAPDEQLYPNGRPLTKAPQLLKALEDAFTLLDRIGVPCITKPPCLSPHLNLATSKSSTAMPSPSLRASKL